MTERFELKETPIAGLIEIVRKRVGDERGYLERLFCVEELAEAGWQAPVRQINRTFTSKAGTLRGMHFQHAPMAEMKLVSCLAGEVLDVAVDLRENSPTYLQWHGLRLSSDHRNSLLIPEGCAHGFQTLTDDVEMLYLHSQVYSPDHEGGLRPTDPRLGIAWPLPVTEISHRDQNHPLLAPIDEG
ncbi:MAG: dTDP-4-dehydrorhamnose 3,5-epimerase [Rhizobiales bacterium]|nr:dTDP-4-dehydrorhamnose 3,5-epimerase [Hyphomicrobiales bacterium]